MKYSASAYSKTLAGAASAAALTSPTLEAVVSIQDFGPTGFSPMENIASTATASADLEKMAFFFNRTGQYVTNSSLADSISAVGLLKQLNRDSFDNGTMGTLAEGNKAKFVGNGSFKQFAPAQTLLGNNDVVNGSLSFQNFTAIPFAVLGGRQRNIAPTTTAGTIAPGPMGSGNRSIVGFREMDAGNTYYGWFDVEFSQNSLTIYGFGVSDTPGEAVPVPEPSNAALLLAMGAAGVAMLRRRRDAAK